MKNLVITGGCGFIGSSLVKKILKDEKFNIRVIDNFSVGDPAQLLANLGLDCLPKGFINDYNWSNRLQVVKSDITNFNEMLELFNGADACVHLAANTGVAPSVDDPFFDCKTNVEGTLNVLECSRQHNLQKFIFASSGAPLGDQIPPLNEQCVPRPSSPYGASKLSGEGYCSAYFNTFKLDTVALRFGNVYGPGSMNKSSAVSKFIKQVLSGNSIEIYGSGEQTRDFIYIDDLVDALLLSIEAANCGGHVFQIATASETSVNELIEALKMICERHDVPFSNILNTKPRLGDVLRNFSDTTKAEKMLGWRAKTVLIEGLEKTLRYFLEMKTP